MQKLSKTQVAQIGAVVVTSALALAPVAFAQFQTPNAGGTGLPNDSSVSTFILKIINIALAVAVLIAVLFLIIGGFRYITSAGIEETAESATKIIVNAITQLHAHHPAHILSSIVDVQDVPAPTRHSNYLAIADVSQSTLSPSVCHRMPPQTHSLANCDHMSACRYD